MIKAIKKGDTVQITGLHKIEHMVDPKVTKETPKLEGEIAPKVSRELSCERVGQNFMITVNGFSTILDIDQATYIGSRLHEGIVTLKMIEQGVLPPGDDFMMKL